jgi:regulatory protein
MQYLAKREYSAFELRQKLSQLINRQAQIAIQQMPAKQMPAEQMPTNTAEQQAAQLQEIEQIIADFVAKKWLSDERFTEQIVFARQSKFGSAKIAYELKQKGIAPDLIAQALNQLQDSQLQQALAICRKKFKQAPSDRVQWAKQARFLQSRGFSLEIIRRVLATDFADEDISDTDIAGSD